jgi:glycosyltransferase involved in cell wall biosynthesis
VFVSDALRAFFLETGRVRPELTAVIPNGIDVESYMSPRDNQLRAKFGASQSQFLVGAVGNLRPAKNYEIFVRAAATLKARCADYRFVVIGLIDDQYGRGIVRLSEELGLGAEMRFAGFRDDIGRAIGTLDAYALTSRSEGFSISLIEALASGLPVVATRCGGPEQIVEDGITGILVQNESANAVANAIDLLHADGDLRRRLASNGRAMVRERFTMLEQVRAYERIYADCLTGRRGPREVRRISGATNAPPQVA